MEIDPSSVAPEVESTRKNLAYTRLEGERLRATVQGHFFAPQGVSDDAAAIATQADLYIASRMSLQRQLNGKEQELHKVEQQIKAASVEEAENEELLKVALAKQERLQAVIDIIARDDFEKLQNDILSYRDKIQ